MKRQANTSTNLPTSKSNKSTTTSPSHVQSTNVKDGLESGFGRAAPGVDNRTKRKEYMGTAATAGLISLLFVGLALWLLNNVETGNMIQFILTVLCIAWGAGGLIFAVNQLLAAYDARE